MAARHGLGTYGNAVGTVTPEDHKLAQAGLIVKDTTGKIRAGLFYTGTETIVSGKANMSYDVAAFTAALTRGASSGTVLLANDGVVNVVTTAAPGSNSRYDVVYVWQREYSLDGTDSNPVIGVVQGTAAASPSVPSLSAFPGAIELARILVPAGVTATNSGTTITQTAKFTAAAGGVVHFRSGTERDAETSLPVGTVGEVSQVLYVFDGSDWPALIPYAGEQGWVAFSASRPSSATDFGATQSFGSLPIATVVELEYLGVADSDGAPSARTFLANFVTTGTGTTLTESVSEAITVASGSTKSVLAQLSTLEIPASTVATAKLRITPNTSARIAAGAWRWRRVAA